MWRRLVRLLRQYPSAVVSVIGEDGYPVSFRCRPMPDSAAQVLVVTAPPDITLCEGRSGLLCHSHNDELWKLKSFHVGGRLEQHDAGWVFVPERLSLGMGHGGLLAKVRLVRNGRRTAGAYLHRRDWEWPEIDWHRFDDIKREVFG